MTKKQELDRLAKRIRQNMSAAGMSSFPTGDDALMLVEMGRQPDRLRSVLETFANDDPKPTVTQIYQRFCGGVQ